jgi:aminopeptidase-like protein
VSYSQPIQTKMTLGELRPHLHTLPEFPEWIPYRTSYYQESWGFCLTHNQFLALQDEEYEVCIQSTLKNGSLVYGEYVIPRHTDEEVLISAHVCHPSLCNDNLSGTVLATYLAMRFKSEKLRYTYRFLFIPGTIGSIAWLAQNQNMKDRIQHGVVLTGVGDEGGFTYKKSRRGNAEIDRVFSHILKHANWKYTIIDFFPYGYDERQYCSPGFNLPMGCLMRTPHGQYPEYHTSGDNLNFIRPEHLEQSFSLGLTAIHVLEENKVYRSLNPFCEPQLGKRGLYRAIGGQAEGAKREMAMLWVLNLSDGEHTLLDIAERASMAFDIISEAGKLLVQHHLLEEVQI